MKRSSGQNWQIELHCPQCGAPVMLEETDQVFSCPYCRVKHALACKEYFSCYLLPRMAAPASVCYMPYWRYRGILFSFGDDGSLQQRVIDSSLQASAAPFLPASLGMRPQALKLRFVLPATEGCFWKVNRPPAQILSEIEQHHGLPNGSTQAGASHSFWVGERLSLIYSPLLVRGQVLYDAIVDSPIGRIPETMIERLTSPADCSAHPAPPRFIPALCPGCGWNLEGEKDALVLFCGNCDAAWECGGEGLTRLDFELSGETADADLLLPFWRIRAAVEGVELNSYADLVRLANLPTIVAGRTADRQLYFWTPAFKVNPRLFLRLARFMTLSQPPDGTAAKRPRLPFHPVTLPAREAVDAIPVVMAVLSLPRRQILARLARIKVKPVEQSLVYLPFAARGNEVFHTRMKISLNSGALRLGRLI